MEDKRQSDIRERRKRDGLKQKELAAFTGVTESYFREVENGTRKPSAELLKKIDYFLELYNPEKKLEILFDYVRIRFPTLDAGHLIEDVLGIRLVYTIREKHAFYGYSAQYIMGDIALMTSEEKEKGCLLELKGKGCRQFEIFLRAQNRSWYDFFRSVEEENGVLKRIDIAINDRAGWLDIPFLAEKCRREEYTTIFHSYRNYQSGELIKAREEDAALMGNTLYLGSLKSEIYFCIYEKDYEQYVKNGVPVADADVKNRFEIRLKDTRAKHAIEDLLSHEDAGKTAFGIINRYVCFLEPGASDDRRAWDMDETWKRFIGEEERQIKLTDAPEPYTLERTLNWIVRQVAPSFKMLTMLSEIRGEEDLLKKLIDNAKLSPQHKKLLEQQRTAVEDMLAGTYADFNEETGEIFA